MQEIDLNNYEVLELEYEDLRFGTIQILNNLETNQMLMCKKIKLLFKDQYIKNLEILRQRKNINNRNILNLVKIIEDETNLNIEVYYEYPTNDIISMKEQLSSDLNMLKKLMTDILNSLLILKKNKFIHSDISPEYIYYNQDTNNFVLLDRLQNQNSFIEVQKEIIENQRFLYQSPNLFEQLICNQKNIEVNPYNEEIYQLGMVIIDILSPEEYNFQKVYNFNLQKFDEKFFNILKQKIEFYYFYGENRKQLGDLLFDQLLNKDQDIDIQQVLTNIEQIDYTNDQLTNQNQQQQKYDIIQSESDKNEDFYDVNLNPSKEQQNKDSMFQTFGGDKAIQSFKMKMSSKNQDNMLLTSSMVSEDIPASLKEKFNEAGSMNFRNSLFKDTPSLVNVDNEVKANLFQSLGKNQEQQTSQNFFENALQSTFQVDQNMDPSHTNVNMNYSKSILTDNSNNLHNSFEPYGFNNTSINSLANKKKSDQNIIQIKKLKTAQNSLSKVPFQDEDEYLHSQKFSQSLEPTQEEFNEDDFQQNNQIEQQVSENTEKIIMPKDSSIQLSYSQVQISNNDLDSTLRQEHSIESNTSTIKKQKNEKFQELKQKRHSKDQDIQLKDNNLQQKSSEKQQEKDDQKDNIFLNNDSNNQQQKIQKRRLLQKNYSGTNFIVKDQGQSLLMKGLCLDQRTKQKLHQLIEQESKSAITEELSKGELEKQIQVFFKENKDFYNEEDYRQFDEQSLITMNDKISQISQNKLQKNPSNLTEISKLSKLSKNQLQLQSAKRMTIMNDAFEIQKLQAEILANEEKQKQIDLKQQQRLQKFQQQNELEKQQLEEQRKQYQQKLQEEHKKKEEELQLLQQKQKSQQIEDEFLNFDDEDLYKLSANTQSIEHFDIVLHQPLQHVEYEYIREKSIKLEMPKNIQVQAKKVNDIQDIFTFNNNDQIQKFLQEKQHYNNIIEKLKQDYIEQQEKMKLDLEQQKILYMKELEQQKQKIDEEKAIINQNLQQEKNKLEIEKAKISQELLQERQKFEDEKQNLNKQFIKKKTLLDQENQQLLDNYETQKKNKLDNLESIKKELNHTNDLAQTQKIELQNDLDQYKIEIQKAKDNLSKQYSEEQNKIEQQKQDLKEQLMIEQKKIESQKQKLEKILEQTKENLDKKVIEFENNFMIQKEDKLKEIESLETQIKQLNTEIKNLQEQKNHNQQEVEELQKWQQAIHVDIESNKQILQEYKEAIDKNKQQLQSFQNEYNQLEILQQDHEQKTKQQLSTQKKTISKIKSNLRKLLKKNSKFNYKDNTNYVKSLFSKIKNKMSKKDKKLNEILIQEKEKMEQQFKEEQKKFIQIEQNFQEIIDRKDNEIDNQKMINKNLKNILNQQQQLLNLKKQNQHKIQLIHQILSNKKKIKPEELKKEDKKFQQKLLELEKKKKEIKYEQQKLNNIKQNIKLELDILEQKQQSQDIERETERQFKKDNEIKTKNKIPLKNPAKKYESKRNISVFKSKNIGFEKRVSPRSSNYVNNLYQTQIDNLPTQRKIILPIQPKTISKSLLPIRIQGHSRSSSRNTEVQFGLKLPINQTRGCKVTYSKKYTRDQNDMNQVNLIAQNLGSSKIELLRRDKWANVYRYKN